LSRSDQVTLEGVVQLDCHVPLAPFVHRSYWVTDDGTLTSPADMGGIDPNWVPMVDTIALRLPVHPAARLEPEAGRVNEDVWHGHNGWPAQRHLITLSDPGDDHDAMLAGTSPYTGIQSR
jgi:hypothetical protein